MFTQKITIKSFTIPFLIGLFAVMMVSCGTQNKAYNQNDGIYASGERASQENNTSNEPVQYERSNYYKQYFETKKNAYGDLAESDEDIIFTDIDAYTTSERVDDEGNIIIEENYDDAYGSWGTNSDDLTVNIYNNYGGYGFGYWNRPYYGWYGSYWGYPYYNYYGPYWGMSLSWGWGYPYYGYYYPMYYGYGYGYPYYYNYPYYNYDPISYNRGRRNTDYSRTEARGRSNNATTRSSYSRNETTRRINRNNVNVRSNNSNVRSNNPNVRTNSNSTIRSNRTTNPRNVRSNSNNRTIRSTPSSNTRNNSSIQSGSNRSSTPRTYSPPTRSSSPSTIRSSSGSSGRSSGSSGSRGRG